MRSLLIAFGAALLAYPVGGFLGGFLLSVLSSNQHDRSVEAAMTGAFVIGPLTAVAAFVAVLVVRHRRAHRSVSGADGRMPG